MTTAGNKWGIVMSRDASYSNQVFYETMCEFFLTVDYPRQNTPFKKKKIITTYF